MERKQEELITNIATRGEKHTKCAQENMKMKKTERMEIEYGTFMKN